MRPRDRSVRCALARGDDRKGGRPKGGEAEWISSQVISIVLKAITKDLRSPSDNDLSVSPASSVIQAPEAGLMSRDVEKGRWEG